MRKASVSPEAEESGKIEQSSASETGTNDSPFPDASRDAKRLAAAILEVLAGTQAPAEAARLLGISVARYYQLEVRGLAGLVTACEIQRRGRGKRPATELVALRRECEMLRRECGRQQALVRAARRTVGLTLPAAPTAAAPKRRRRRPTARALKMAALLRTESVRSAPHGVAEEESSAGTATDVVISQVGQ